MQEHSAHEWMEFTNNYVKDLLHFPRGSYSLEKVGFNWEPREAYIMENNYCNFCQNIHN